METQEDTQRGEVSQGWREIWQIPLLATALLLFIAGAVTVLVTRPEPDYHQRLDRAETRIDRQEFEEALATLNAEIGPYTERDGFKLDHRQRYHLLVARSLYHGQRKRGIDRSENHENVVTQYRQAERAGATLDPRDVERLALSLLALRRFRTALEYADGLADSEGERRRRIYRDAIERRLVDDGDAEADALELVAEMMADPDLPIPDRAWAVARRAELLMGRGRPDQAITLLLRSMPGLLDLDGALLGDLYLILGRAYLATREHEEAVRHLQRAEGLMPRTEPQWGEVQLLLGSLEETDPNPDGTEQLLAARRRYEQVIERFGDDPVYLAALLRFAEVEAGLGDDEASLGTYAQLLEELPLHDAHPDINADVIARSLLERFQSRFDTETRTALRYALLAEDLYGVGLAPPPVVHAMARGHRSLAEQLLEGIRRGPIDLLAIDPGRREEARRHLNTAGRYFRLHSDLTAVDEPEASADSLWLSADSFDWASNDAEAINGFLEFIGSVPRDARRAEARFRLGESYQARGENERAIEMYTGLLADREQRDGPLGVGPFADRSVVPLARAYLADSDVANDAQAEQLLQRALNGELGSPDSLTYRDALVELGSLAYTTGAYPRAIEHLHEAVERYPDHETIDRLRFQLADSHRLHATEIAGTLETSLPLDQRRALVEAREASLLTASGLFRQVRTNFEAESDLAPLDQVYLRNACFYLGDCSFDMGNYADARTHYDEARERYPRDPASLVALMQIVNSYMEQGDLISARTANERARRFYQRVPAEAWNDPRLPMSRADWERWLDSSAELNRLAAELTEATP